MQIFYVYESAVLDPELSQQFLLCAYYSATAALLEIGWSKKNPTYI